MNTIISKGKNFWQKLKTRTVILLSSVIITASIVLILTAFFIWKSGILHSILLTMGTSGLSAGIISLAIEVFLTDIFSEAIKDKFKLEIETLKNDIKEITSNTSLLSPKIERLRQSLDNFSIDDALIRGCNEAQIKYLSLNRMASEELKKSIMECMENSKEIKMLGTTLRQFFTKDRDLKEKLRACAINKQIKVLIANPFTKSVVKRTLLEQGEYFERECKKDPLYYRLSETYTDIRDTITAYKREFNGFQNINLKCYNDFPSMWLIITDTCAFFQPYQYGRIQDTLCIGESFVVIKFGRGHAFDLLSQHFDYIWNDKSNIEPDEMLKKYENDKDILAEILKDEDVYWRD